VLIVQHLSVTDELTHAACVGSFSAVIDPLNTRKPLFVEAEPLLVSREDAARLLCVSTREVDRLRASGQIVARRHGRRVLFAINELRRFVESLPLDELGA
jgi:Helix-turn-helix domain